MEKIKRKKTQKEFASSKKVSTFAAPFGNGGIEKLFYNIGFQISYRKICRFRKSDYLCNPFRKRGIEKLFYNFGFQIFQIKFADSKKVIIFAIPIAREGLAISRKAGFFSAKLEKIIEKTDKNKYKQVPRN